MWTRTESPLQETRFLVHKVAPGNYALDYHYSGYIGENYTFKLRPTTLAFKVETGEVIFPDQDGPKDNHNYLFTRHHGKFTSEIEQKNSRLINEVEYFLENHHEP